MSVATDAVVDLSMDKGWGARIIVRVAATEAADRAATEFLRRVTTYTPGDNYHVADFSESMEQDAVVGAQLMDFLCPTCEHGMSALLCAGPGHYPMDDPYRD